MTFANMASMPTQTAGSSPILASDWNTFVRDNFADIRAGHTVCTSGTRPSSGLIAGTMVFETDTSKIMLYNGSSWVEAFSLAGSGAAFPVTTPVGMVSPFAGATAPSGWLLCDGNTYNGNVGQLYNTLYTVIGTTYGGTQAAFNVPNLQGRVIVGAGTGAQNGTSGSGVITGGTALTARTRGDWFGDQFLQAHTHTGTTDSAGAVSYASIVNNTNFAAGSGIGQRAIVNTSQAGGLSGYEGLSSFSTASNHQHTFTSNTHNQTAGAQANLQPSLVLNYIIKF